ncbi:glycoprotein hormone beta-5-like [Plakobranchus ocellatus]|uniref:Glycoprotein hormone beta-5-like n=1 Tax=Plakobranchus ocellatus TaxID=259542 RepID=A0AAV4BAR3_9GAST|nr:glycoprotein hormone beta-5-like [Plakobranchus ocellatus]
MARRAVGYQVRGPRFESQSGSSQFSLLLCVHLALNGQLGLLRPREIKGGEENNGKLPHNAVGDYIMPFRISRHPVCTYRGRIRRRVTLSNCAGYPDPTVEVFDAAGCECRICDSDYTSCENLNG